MFKIKWSDVATQIVAGVVAGVVLLIFAFIFSQVFKYPTNADSGITSAPGLSSNFYDCVNNRCELKECPYVCCDGSDFKLKICPTEYECASHTCKPVDSDGDGLTNIEENLAGTNPKLVDSDEDTWSDYQEVKIHGTNPLNPNTDGDRYKDNVDPNPLENNTAIILVTKINEEGNYDWVTVAIMSAHLLVGSGATAFTVGTAAPAVLKLLTNLGLLEKTIYMSEFDIVISNIGTDYSSFVNYEVNYYIGNRLIFTQEGNSGRVDVGAREIKHVGYSIKAKDVPAALWEILNGKPAIQARIEHVQYEKF